MCDGGDVSRCYNHSLWLYCMIFFSSFILLQNDIPVGPPNTGHTVANTNGQTCGYAYPKVNIAKQSLCEGPI